MLIETKEKLMKLVYIILAIFSLNTFFVHAETMQKRQYRKRHHKLQINATSLSFSKQFDANGAVDLAYAYNFGYFETGVLLGLKPEEEIELYELKNDYKKIKLSFGFNFEGNFIENKRRNNWIPSLGLKVYYLLGNGAFVQPYVSSKHFVSSRTSINIELAVPLQVWEWDLKNIYDGFHFSVGYAYYFH